MYVEFGMAYCQILNACKRFPQLQADCPDLLATLAELKPQYPAAIALIPKRTTQPVYQSGQWPIANDALKNVSAKLQNFKFYEAILQFMVSYLYYYPEYHQWSAQRQTQKRQAYYRELQRLGELKNKAAQHISTIRCRPQDALYFNDDFYPLEMPLTGALCLLEPQLRRLTPSAAIAPSYFANE